MKSSQFSITSDGQGAVSGVMGYDSVKALEKEGNQFILQQSGNEVTINLEKVTQTDSAGLAALLGWMRFALKCQKEIKFLYIPQQLIALAQISDLENVLQGNK